MILVSIDVNVKYIWQKCKVAIPVRTANNPFFNMFQHDYTIFFVSNKEISTKTNKKHKNTFYSTNASTHP